jgi:plastocyanin
MPKTVTLPVVLGLAVGIGFLVLFAILMNNFPTLRVQSTSSSGQVSIVVIPEGAYSPESGKTYEPQVIRVVIGMNDTVRWVNQDITANWIEADNNDDPDFANVTLNPKLLAPGESFEYSFTKAGQFGYHGKPWQRGTVIVVPHP